MLLVCFGPRSSRWTLTKLQLIPIAGNFRDGLRGLDNMLYAAFPFHVAWPWAACSPMLTCGGIEARWGSYLFMSSLARLIAHTYTSN
eukprot:1162025-Pelagomonas_calceolata.AAC.12